MDILIRIGEKMRYIVRNHRNPTAVALRPQFTKKYRNGPFDNAKGVYYDGKRGMWLATIMRNYKKIYLGRFTTKIGAMHARERAERINP